MLSQALRTRTRQHTSIFRLHLHQQHFDDALTPVFEKEEGTLTPDNPGNETRAVSAYIETWEPLHSVADAWTLLRAVELKYGKIVEAKFLKDSEMITKYQMRGYITFLDQKSLERVPKIGVKFHIPAPVVENQPGGVGLDDIKHLLDIVDRDPSFEFPNAAEPETKSTERVIGVRMSPAEADAHTIPNYYMTSANKGLARRFLGWGGFHKLEPIAPRDISQREWFAKPDWEQVRMRAALQRCSQITGFANPAVNHKLTAHENDGKVSDSSPASASIDLPESSSSTTLEIPISHESTSKSTQSCSLQTEVPQPPSQSPPELTQLAPEPTLPEPTISRPGQLTPEQKKTMQKQMSKVKGIMVKTKQPATKKERKPKKEPKKEPTKVPTKEKPEDLDKSPEEPSQSQSASIVANFWKFLGR